MKKILERKYLLLVPLSLFLIAVFATVDASASDAALPDPVAWWRFEEGAGEIAFDATDNEHTARLVNNPGYSADTPPALGESSFALSLDGADDYVLGDVSDAFEIKEEVTIAVWVKLADAANNQKIVGRAFSSQDPSLPNQGYVLSVINNKLYPEVFYGDNTSTWFTLGEVPNNEWVHLAFTWKRNDALIGYVNGQEVGNFATPDKSIGIDCVAFCQPVLGAVPWNPQAGELMAGLMDDAQIYDVALSAEQVERLTNTILPTNPNGASRDTGDERPDSVADRAESDVIAYYDFTSGDFSNGGLIWDNDFNGMPYQDLEVIGDSFQSADYHPYLHYFNNEYSALVIGSLDQYLRSDDDTGFNTISDAFTLSAWVYPTTVTGDQAIVGSANNTSGSDSGGYVLGLRGDEIHARMWDNTGNEFSVLGGDIPILEWTHVSVTWAQNGKMRVYQNGKQVNAKNASANPVGNQCQVSGFDCSLIVGARPWDPTTDPLIAYIDEIYVFKSELTPGEVLWLSGQQTSTPIGQPVGYWKFDEESGTTALDHSGNELNGTLVTGGAGGPDYFDVSLPNYPTRNKSWLNFDGKNGTNSIADADYVRIPNDPKLDLTTGATLAAWVKLDAGAENQKVLGKNGTNSGPKGYNLAVIDNSLYPEFFTASGASNFFQIGHIPNGIWTHIAVTWEQGEYMVGYINGLEVDRMVALDSPIAIPLPNDCNGGGQQVDCDFIIGGLPWAPPIEPVDGGIDEVIVFDRALDPDQIFALTDSGFRGLDTYDINATINLNVVPSAFDDAYEIDEDVATSFNVMENDSDPEDDVFTIATVGMPAHGSATISGGEILYTPAADYVGPDQFYYSIEQAGTPLQFAKVNVNMLSVNDPPTAVYLNNMSIDEFELGKPNKKRLVGLLSSDDPDEVSVVTFDLTPGVASNNNFVVQSATWGYDLGYQSFESEYYEVFGPSLWVTADLDYETSTTQNISVRMFDGDLAPVDVPVTINVLDNDDAPTGWTLSNNSAAENVPIGSVIGTLTAIEPDGGNTTYSYQVLNGDSAAVPFEVVGNQLRTTKPLDFERQTVYQVKINVFNGLGYGSGDSTNINITDIVGAADVPNNTLDGCNGSNISLINTSVSTVEIRNVTVTNIQPEGCDIDGDMAITLRGTTITNIDFDGRVNQFDRVESTAIEAFQFDIAGMTFKAGSTRISYTGTQPRLYIGAPRLKVPADWGGAEISLVDPFGGQSNEVVIDASGLILGQEFSLPTIGTGNGLQFALSGSLTSVTGGYEIAAKGEVTIPNLGKKATRAANKGQSCSINAGVTLFYDANGRSAMRIHEEPVIQNFAQGARNGLALRQVTAGFTCDKGIPIGATGAYLTAMQGTITLTGSGIEDISLQVSATVQDKAGIVTLQGSLGLDLSPFEVSVDASVKLFDSVTMGRTSATLTTYSFKFNIEARFWGPVFVNADVSAWIDNNNKFHFTASGSGTIRITKGEIVGSYCAPKEFTKLVNCAVEVVVVKPAKTVYKAAKTFISWFSRDTTATCNGPTYIENICTPAIPPFSFTYTMGGIQVGEFNDGKYGVAGYANLGFLGSYGVRVDESGGIKFNKGSNFVLASSRDIRLAREARADGRMSVQDGFEFPDDGTVLITVPFADHQIELDDETSRSGTRATNNIDEHDVLFTMSSGHPLQFKLIPPTGGPITTINYSNHPDYDVSYEQRVTYKDQHGNVREEDATRLRVAMATTDTAYDGVDVKIDGVLTWSNLTIAQPETFGYVDVVSGTHQIEVLATGTNTVLETQSVTFAGGEDKTLYVYGNPGMVTETTDTNTATPIAGFGRVRFINGSNQSNLSLFVNGEFVSNLGMGTVVNYLTLAAGTHSFELRLPASRNLEVMRKLQYVVEDGNSVTMISADWDYTVDDIDYTADTMVLVDERLDREIVTTYAIDGLSAVNNWQVAVEGAVTTSDYVVTVDAPDNPPELANMTIDPSNVSAAPISWNLTSNYAPSTMRVYLSEGPITRTVTITDSNGNPVTSVIPTFDGRQVAEYTITAANELNGSTTNRTLDLSDVITGDYYIWFEADDGVNPAIRGYGTPISSARDRAALDIDEEFGMNSVDFLDNDYDAIRQQRNANVIAIDQTAAFPSTWVPAITQEFDAATRALYLEWDAIDHPDIDQYEMDVTISGIAGTQTIGLGGNVIDEDANGNPLSRLFGYGEVANVEPGRSYNIVIRAIDDETGSSVTAAPIVFSRPTGDFSLTTSAPFHQVDAGQTATVPVSLNVISPLYYQGANLRVESDTLPPGLVAYFEDAADGAVTVNTSRAAAALTVSVGPNVPEGVYQAKVIGFSGAELEREVYVTIRVGNTVPLAVTVQQDAVSTSAVPMLVLSGFLVLLAASHVVAGKRRRELDS